MLYSMQSAKDLLMDETERIFSTLERCTTFEAAQEYILSFFEDISSLSFPAEREVLPVSKDQHKSGKHRGKGIRYASSQELQEKGTKAELLVIHAMQEQPQRFINVKNWDY